MAENEPKCPSSQKPNAASCGRDIPILQKHGLTASPLLPAAKRQQKAVHTEDVLEASATFLTISAAALEEGGNSAEDRTGQTGHDGRSSTHPTTPRSRRTKKNR